MLFQEDFFELRYANELNYLILPIFLVFLILYYYRKIRKTSNMFHFRVVKYSLFEVLIVIMLAILGIGTFNSLIMAALIIYPVGLCIVIATTSYILKNLDDQAQ